MSDISTSLDVTPPDFFDGFNWTGFQQKFKRAIRDTTPEGVPDAVIAGCSKWIDNSGEEAVQTKFQDVVRVTTPEEQPDSTIIKWVRDTWKQARPRVVVPYPGRRMRDVVTDNAPPGEDISLRFDINYDYTLIEVVSFDSFFVQKRPFFPTQWLAMTNPYWKGILDLPQMYRDEEKYEVLSRVDGCLLEICANPRGEITVKRNGVKVILSYENGGTGGFPQPVPLREIIPAISPPNRRKEQCVDTLHIPLECPYWSELICGLVTRSKGCTKWRRSEFDQVKCQVLIESDGRIQVRRDNVQVEILGPKEQ